MDRRVNQAIGYISGAIFAVLGVIIIGHLVSQWVDTLESKRLLQEKRAASIAQTNETMNSLADRLAKGADGAFVVQVEEWPEDAWGMPLIIRYTDENTILTVASFGPDATMDTDDDIVLTLNAPISLKKRAIDGAKGMFQSETKPKTEVEVEPQKEESPGIFDRVKGFFTKG